MELYPEFVPIYVGMAVALVLLLAILILAVVLVVKVGRLSAQGKSGTKTAHGGKGGKVSGNVVFCRNCAAEFAESEKCCPKCGTPR